MPQLLSERDSGSADLAQCDASLRGGSRSFFVASLLLPRTVARRASAIYAFCRLADDLIDGGGGAYALVELERRLDGVFAGRPEPFPADRALTAVLREASLPRESFDALIEGFSWDAEGRRYETIADLRAYAARVAGSVGILMSSAMGSTAPHTLARAADLGVAMQLTNIARDVGEDARMGRLYLPLQWLREAGIDADAFLKNPSFSPALASVVQRLLREADRHYARADAGLAQLPLTCRPAMHVAARLYAEIGAQILRNGGDSVSRRAVVSHARKAVVAVRPRLADPQSLRAPPLAETAFLIDAAAFRVPVAAQVRPAWWNLRGRTLQVITLFERLERAERGRVRA